MPRTINHCTLEAAGGTWDAIRVPHSVGLVAMRVLGDRSGAVLQDRHELALYWFVAGGSAAGWDVPNTRALGADSHLVMPPRRRTQGPGPHWRICPGEDKWLTDAPALRAAIEDALGPAMVKECGR
ncbi:hypothetical protein [Streptomyces sp. NPDC000410]|uniref:hypothetical protein n=1 Tax=Streptomyces sp. NPDC000410 TaxID=3154254 RepID=UPI003326C6BF